MKFEWIARQPRHRCLPKRISLLTVLLPLLFRFNLPRFGADFATFAGYFRTRPLGEGYACTHTDDESMAEGGWKNGGGLGVNT